MEKDSESSVAITSTPEEGDKEAVATLAEEDSMCCDPRRGYFRFGGLFFMCFLGFGSYFCYDTPGSLQDQIKEDMDVNTVQLFGIRLGTIIFSTIVTLGQFAYAFGALIDEFWMMQLGRFIFGVGGESLAVAQNAYTVSWFKGKELNTVFGLQLSMARVGSTVNFLSMGPIYSRIDQFEDGHVTLGISLMIAGATCVFSLACALILGMLDRRRTTVLRLNESSTGEKIQLKDILSFPLSFWLISVVCVTYYVAIFPFIGLAKVFFMRKYDLGENGANAVSSIVYIISAFASPLFGFLVDKTGRNIMWVFIAVLVSLGSHCLLAFTFLNPFIPMVDSKSEIHGSHILLHTDSMQSIQNLGLALISMLGGLIVDTKGYLYLEIFYIIWLCVALTSTIGMWTADKA
ncbi:Major facilitator superfamily domain-containing protein 1 [Armadillidium nasatum]|uniref:Lysosomal dipeptide transporter MFSD1 n=1 Tax=Armadillidium nasatum TaxID=96803 RepID=A0A5N5T8Z8_9CRUS|nr:Major facilitator superfamily domain-containing protein 1 [Armadillidium nasatum]